RNLDIQLMPWFLFSDRKDVVFAEDLEFLVIDLYFRAPVLGNEYAVTFLDFERNALAALIHLAGPHRSDDRFRGLFLGGVGDDNPTPVNILFCEGLDQNASTQWFQ